jgi:hypothetical protein
VRTEVTFPLPKRWRWISLREPCSERAQGGQRLMLVLSSHCRSLLSPLRRRGPRLDGSAQVVWVGEGGPDRDRARYWEG